MPTALRLSLIGALIALAWPSMATAQEDSARPPLTPDTVGQVVSLAQIDAREEALLALGLADDAAPLGVVQDGADVRVVDVASGEATGAFEGCADAEALWGSVTPAATQVMLGCADGWLRLWDLEDGTLLDSYEADPVGTRGVVFTPEGWLLAGGEPGDDSVRLVDPVYADLILLVDTPGYAAMAFALSPDGSLLAVGGDDGALHVWDVAAGEEIIALVGHTGGITATVFSADGARLASAGTDGVIQVWGIATAPLTDDAILAAVNANLAAAVAEDVDAYLATLHPASPYYAPTAQMIGDFFASHELRYEVSDVTIVSRSATEALVRLTQRTEQISGPSDFNDNISVILYTLRPATDGTWRLYFSEVVDVVYLE